ncbi:hypothetical protein ECPV1252_44500 [Escherichia coli]
MEWVQSFADERCGRAGVVYQASNFDFIGSHESTFYELDGEWYHEITMTAIKRGGQRGEYLRANKERAVVHKFNQYRYIRLISTWRPDKIASVAPPVKFFALRTA